MAVSYNPRIVTDGLILCLDAANVRSYPKTGTTWYDLSGRNYHGTLINGPAFTNINNGAISFDGTDDYCSLTQVNLFSLLSGIRLATVALWVYPRSSSRNSYIADWNTSGGQESFRIEMSGYSMTSGRIGGTLLTNNSEPVQTSSSVTLNRWHHIAISVTVSDLLLYWNGKIDDVKTPSNKGTFLSNPIILGRAGSWDAFYSNVIFSNLHIYNRCLSASEISQNYNATKGRYGL